MSFDPGALAAAVAAHGAVVRVVVAEVKGSAPREAGAAMLVWAHGQSGTIGGGALEWEAARRARAMLRSGEDGRVDRLALGPELAQCCGGAVVLVSERFHAANLPEGVAAVARRLPGGPAEPPLAVARILARARRGERVGTLLVHGWLVEPVARPQRALWVWGAGHVGRAIVATLAPLPDLCIVWLDTGPDRFPASIPEGATISHAADPADLVAEAPAEAEHLVLTFSHALDLELCHRLLRHGFRSLGLIGSASKAVRFRSRLAALGHRPAEIARIRCPIGAPGLGKHPQAIAIGVAAEILNDTSATTPEKDAPDDRDGTAFDPRDHQGLSGRRRQ